MKQEKRNWLIGQSSVRNRFKVFRRIVIAILLLIAAMFIIACLGHMERRLG